MSKKIATPEPYDYKVHTRPEKKSKLKNSKTVPDVNYTIRDILNKFTTGQPITGMMSYNDYDGDYDNNGNEKPDFDSFQPHPKTLDLVDRQILAKQNKIELKEIEKRESDRKAKHQKDLDDHKAQLKAINDFQQKNQTPVDKDKS